MSFKLFVVLIVLHVSAIGQSISPFIGGKIKSGGKYLFYLHAGVVTVLGNNAINQSVPEWGPYEYLNILDSLRVRGFNVISENRKQGIDDSVYVNKIVKQIDTLLVMGTAAQNILVIGASSGWNIGIQVSDRLKNKNLNFVIMGGCWPETYKDYTGIELYGRFLSIIESSDPHGTCMKIFDNRKYLTSIKEITLNTGMSHGFFYKGHRHWIDPIIDWFSHDRE